MPSHPALTLDRVLKVLVGPFFARAKMERPEAWREKGVGMWSVRAAECDLMIPGSSTNIKYSDNTCKPGSFRTNTTELRSTWISDSTFYPSVPLHVRHVAVVCGVARTLTDPIGPAALPSHCARAIAKRPRRARRTITNWCNAASILPISPHVPNQAICAPPLEVGKAPGQLDQLDQLDRGLTAPRRARNMAA